MNTYIVKLVFEVSVDNRHDHFDEQLRFFSAASAAEALDQANAVADAEAQQFVNAAGLQVEWAFKGVPEIVDITGCTQGSLIMSGSSYHDEPETYSRYLAAKAIAITDKNPIFV